MTDKQKILVVDNNSGNRLLMKYSLEGYFNIDFASSGLSAINKFKVEKYDLILMDIRMPDMDGIQTTIKIRQMEDEKVVVRTPIFAMTSGIIGEEKEQCFDAGMDDYLLKPIHAQLLVERINICLNTLYKG